MALGAILAHDMTIECIIAKLSYLLGKNYSIAKVKQSFNQSLRGELTDMRKQSNQYSFENNSMVKALVEVLNVNDQNDIK